nr:rhodanese-like domain-containing protein [uncultured Deefgea sp.]
MQIVLRVLLLMWVSMSAVAADFTFNGVKPAVIIDVRTAEEFAAGHLEGAVNIPYEQIGKGIHTVKSAGKNSPILIYCRSGRRSAIAVKSLEQIGFQRVYDGGGMAELQSKLQRCAAKTC